MALPAMAPQRYPAAVLELRLFAISLAVLIGATVYATKSWRFRRLSLRGFDTPFVPTGPFRHADPEIRPLYGRVRDAGSIVNFAMHVLVAYGGAASLAMLMWAGVTAMEQSLAEGLTASAQGALLGSISAAGMWLGHRKLHLIGGAVLTVFAFVVWPPAAPLVFILLVVQHDLMRRRMRADELEAKRVQSL